MAQTRFTVSIDIAAPPSRVWPVMSDVERWHEWTASITSVTRRDEGPFRVGSSAVVRQPRLPRAVWTVTVLQPFDERQGRASFTWVSRGPGALSIATHAVEAIPGGTRATLTLEYTGWFGRLLARFFRAITEEYLDLEIHGLKRRSELT